jgi:iron complex outermembrane receptor protein
MLAGGMFHVPLAGAQTTDAALPAVTVRAETTTPESLPAPYVGGQVARGARLGVLGNVDVMDTPFNVTGYTAELIENQGARTIADVLTNDPSVRFTTSTGHAYENFRIRGFDVNQNDLAINGMFGLTPVGHTPVEMFERVEVLKGPNALFGGMSPSGAVGGVINLVPKRADDEPLSRVSVGAQSSSQLATTVDLGRRLGEGKEWGIRVNGSLSDGDTGLNGQSKKREFLSGALDYRSGGLKASLDAYTSKESFKGGIPAMFWMAGTSIAAAPDPGVNQFPAARGELESSAVIARAEYTFNPNVSAFAGIGARKHDFSGFLNGTHIRNINAAGASANSVTVASRGYDDAVSSEAGLRLNFNTSDVMHEMVLQATRLEQESGAASATSSFATNIYNPVFHAMPAIPALASKTGENTLSSVALVDTLSFLQDALRLTLGARHQTVKTTNFNAAGAVTGAYDKSAVTPAVAVVFKPWGPGISLYANYVKGLSKGDTISRPTYVRNYTFAPYETVQKEVGVKWNAGSFTSTASLFEIAKPMLISVGGNDASDDGEKRVRGLEWNTFGELARGVRLLGGAAYNQGVQTKTANNTHNGNVAVGVPRWQGNLGLEWDAPVPGLTLSGRVVTSSSQYLNAANTQKIAGWSDLQLGARYTTKLAGRHTVFRLNVANAFDRHYYSGSFSDTTPIATLGQPRTVTASVTVDF